MERVMKRDFVPPPEVIDENVLVNNILEMFSDEEIEEFITDIDYHKYADKPVEFCEEVLQEKLTEDIKIMLESVRDNPVTVAVSANAVGKTHGASRAAIWWMKCLPQSLTITAAAPPAERNLKAKLWGEIRTVIKLHPKMFKGDKVTSLNIENGDDPQNVVMGVTIPVTGSDDEREAKFSGHHAPNLLFVLDEGDAIPDEIYRAIESCASGGKARLLVMFNPKRKLGAVYRMIRDGKCVAVNMNAFSHPNVLSGEDIILGAVSREKTVKRINEWTRPLGPDDDVDANCFQVPDFLVGETALNDRSDEFPPLQSGWRRIEEPQFCYMVLGEYPIQSTHQLIADEWIENARARWDAYVAENGRVGPLGVPPRVGLDAAELGGDFNTLCVRYGGWVKEIRSWSGMDTHQTARRASLMYHELEGAVVNVDSTGVGAGIAPLMNLTFRMKCPDCQKLVIDVKEPYQECPSCLKKDKHVVMDTIYCNAKRIMVASSPTEKSDLGEFGVLRDQLWWTVREWLKTDPGAMLPPDEKLLEELSVPEYEIRGGKVKVMAKDTMRKHLARSPDKADALCLAFVKDTGRPRARLL